jgi:hypothetical protein
MRERMGGKDRIYLKILEEMLKQFLKIKAPKSR